MGKVATTDNVALLSNRKIRYKNIRPFQKSQSLRATLCSETFSPPNYGQSVSFHPLCQIWNHNRDCSHSPTVHDNGAIAVWLCGRDAFKRQITSNPIWWEGHQACSSTCLCPSPHPPRRAENKHDHSNKPTLQLYGSQQLIHLKDNRGNMELNYTADIMNAISLRAPLHLYKSYCANKISGWR